MKETLISFETAELAKEKGFSYAQKNVYLLDQFKKANLAINKALLSTLIQAPTQSLLQKWLREEHNKYLSIRFIKVGESDSSYVISIYCWEKWETFKVDIEVYFNFATYEQALEIALQEALKLIKS